MADFEAVTPQRFGAKGDGVSDDTDAFQAAVESGYDLYVPTSLKETYRITRTIYIPRKGSKRIFTEPYFSRDANGCILADFSQAEDPKKAVLFNVGCCGITFGGLRIISQDVDGHRAGVMISAMATEICDYDLKVINCGIRGFYRVADFMGRGLEILNGQIASCNYIAYLHWDDQYDTSENHPPQYDQRAIAIKNCRLHSIGSGFINVKSGHAYGLHFEGNTIDNGKGYLLRAYDQAWGWNVSGNIVQGIRGDFAVLDFRKGMLNSVISANTFLADEGYWTDTAGTVNSWVKCGGTAEGSIISNNVFKNSGDGFLVFKNMSGMAVTGNVFHNLTASQKAAITVTGTNRKSMITGNVTL